MAKRSPQREHVGVTGVLSESLLSHAVLLADADRFFFLAIGTRTFIEGLMKSGLKDRLCQALTVASPASVRPSRRVCVAGE